MFLFQKGFSNGFARQVEFWTDGDETRVFLSLGNRETCATTKAQAGTHVDQHIGVHNEECERLKEKISLIEWIQNFFQAAVKKEVQ